MIRKELNVEDTVAFLNELVKIDRQAMQELVESRVVCNDGMAGHSTVQVQDVRDPDSRAGATDTVPAMGFLGVLNGLFGVFDEGPKKGCGPIAASFSDDGSGSLFEFRLTKECL